MKKLMLAIGILLLTNSMFAQEINPEILNKLKLGSSDVKIRTTVGVEIGKASRDCAGVGLCIIVEKKITNYMFSYGKNKLALALDKSLYSKEKLKENFGTGAFVLDEDFEFSKEITQKFKAGSELSGKLLFKKGSHKVLVTKNYYIILQ